MTLCIYMFIDPVTFSSQIVRSMRTTILFVLLIEVLSAWNRNTHEFVKGIKI